MSTYLKDSFVSTQGKCLLDLCISSGMRILNGRHEGDSNGEFTCFTTNGSSVVDYVVASSEIMRIIEDFSINFMFRPLSNYVLLEHKHLIAIS